MWRENISMLTYQSRIDEIFFLKKSHVFFDKNIYSIKIKNIKDAHLELLCLVYHTFIHIKKTKNPTDLVNGRIGLLFVSKDLSKSQFLLI